MTLPEDIHGWIFLDKPVGLTSNATLSRVKRLLGRKIKAGFVGTLDPFASGLLPIAIGEATKTIFFMDDTKKTYEFEITFGSETDTGDCDGEVTSRSEMLPSKEDLQKALPYFLGEIVQIPPKFSAIKIKGKRAYDLARKNIEVEMPSRKVQIYSLTLLQYEASKATFLTECGKGTYIRSLGRDIARYLGCLGYISTLRRTNLGKFSIKNAISLDKLEEMLHNAPKYSYILPLDLVLDDIPVMNVNVEEAKCIRYGRCIPLAESLRTLPEGATVFVKFEAVALALGSIKDNMFHPSRVFNIKSNI